MRKLMRTLLVLPFVLLGSALWLHGQEGVPGLDRVQAPTQPTVQGCLQRSASYYFIIQKDGTQTQLEGSGGKLSHYVGHEVQISGKPTIITIDTTEAGAASTVDEIPVLYVKSVTGLSATCTSATP